MDKIQIRTCLDGEVVDMLVMQGHEMCARPELALQVIRRRAEQVLVGKVQVKRIVYRDEEGDSCTLTAPSMADALDLCKGGVLLLQVVPASLGTASSLHAEELMDELLKRVKGLNLKRVWERLGEAGLELLAELQKQWQEDWAELIQPLNALASGMEIPKDDLLQLAIQMYQKMDGSMQEKVNAYASCTLEAIVKELSAPPTILCNSCGLAVSVGHLCVFCAGDAKPEREATRPRAEQVDTSVAATALMSLLEHPDKVVREAAQLALEAAAAAPKALCDDAVSVSDRWSWELISEATTTEAEPEELEPLIPLAG
mmetsp:Transcript_37294/g.80291  ORF Transcript_37294/g.80291 Transcript_37294/m.80291 type:complete len:314 (+) Transcript_37294:86-1027(+)